MNREKSLVKNTIILSLGTYLPKMTSIITLPILTQYLTQAEYGSYDLIITLVSLLLPALTLQIQSAAFRFLITCRDDKEKISEIVTNIFAFTIPVSLFGLTLTYFFLGKFDTLTRLLIIMYFFSDIIYIGFGQVTRGLGKNAIYASAAVLISLTNMIGIIVSILVFHAGLRGVLFSMLISNLFGNIVLALRIGIWGIIDVRYISLKKIRELLAYSWPMVPNALSNWVLSLSDRMVILSFLGVEMNAVYAVANKLPNLAKAFQGTFTSAWQENASLSVEDNDSKEYYSRMIDSINNIVIGIVAVLIACTPILFRILIRGEYGAAYQQMSFLYIGMYFSCMSGVIGGIYIAHMKTKSVGLTTMCAALINLVIDLLLIQHIGLFAASISTMVAYGALLSFRIIDVQRFQPLNINYIKFTLLLLAIGVMSFAVSRRIHWIDIGNAGFGIVLAIALNFELVKIIMRKIAKRYIRKMESSI